MKHLLLFSMILLMISCGERKTVVLGKVPQASANATTTTGTKTTANNTNNDYNQNNHVNTSSYEPQTPTYVPQPEPYIKEDYQPEPIPTPKFKKVEIECYHCGGDRFIVHRYWMGGDHVAETKTRCPICRGTGKVTQTEYDYE